MIVAAIEPKLTVKTGSAFDGWTLGFLVTSTAVFATCRMAFERELTLNKQLVLAQSQSRPISAEEMKAVEKAHHERMATLGDGPKSPPSNKN
jgi:hypothetical protein